LECVFPAPAERTQEDILGENENEKWPQALSTLRFRAILTEARNDRMFSFLASGIKKHYDIGATLGK
jgi:hypothetical protein